MFTQPVGAESPMISCWIDHLVVTSGTLRTGIEFIEDLLHIRMQTGGQHVRMGTHNALLKLGQGLYLEVIAVDPTLPPPKRPRWFELDRISNCNSPELSTWVVRTDSLSKVQNILTVSPGSIEAMERGEWKWKITMPADGNMPLNGAFPSFIQWETDVHPSDRMLDSGISLQKLEIQCDDSEMLCQNLQLAGFNGPVVVKASTSEQRVRLKATLMTETGLRTLG